MLTALAYPLILARRREVFAWQGTGTLDNLLAQRDGLYASLRDLDQDLALGKLDNADYERLKARYMMRAAETLARLDAIRAETQRSDDELTKSIEKEVLALRGKIKPKRQAPAAGKANVQVKAAAGYCRNCGAPHQSGDKFCTRCGQKLA